MDKVLYKQNPLSRQKIPSMRLVTSAEQNYQAGEKELLVMALETYVWLEGAKHPLLDWTNYVQKSGHHPTNQEDELWSGMLGIFQTISVQVIGCLMPCSINGITPDLTSPWPHPGSLHPWCTTVRLIQNALVCDPDGSSENKQNAFTARDKKDLNCHLGRRFLRFLCVCVKAQSADS